MRMFSKVTASMSALALSLMLSGAALAADTGTVTGTVKDAEGKAVAAGVAVRVLPPGGGGKKVEPKADKGEKKGRPAPVAEGKTEDGGKYTIKDVPVGEYRVTAGDRALGMGNANVTVKAGETATADITLKAPKAK